MDCKKNPPPLNRTREEWQNILRTNPRISELAKEAIQDILGLHDALTDVLKMTGGLTGAMAAALEIEQ